MFRPSIAGARSASFALLVGWVIAGCAASDTPLTAPQEPAFEQVSGMYDPVAGLVSVGFYSGPAGTYSVRTTVVGGGDYAVNGERDFTFTTALDDVTGRSGYVYLQANEPSWHDGLTAAVTIRETALPPGTLVDSIKILYNGVFLPTVIGKPSVTITVGFLDVAEVNFFNSVTVRRPPPAPTSACSPAYWKHSRHLDSWPSQILPTQLIGSSFESASLYSTRKLGNLGSLTLLHGLELKGGGSPAGTAQILLRSGVAALLNARSSQLSYPMTEASVRTAVNAALASGDRDRMLTVGMRLHNYNDAHCPLH